METAIVYKNRHVSITSNYDLNNQPGRYINYAGLKALLDQGVEIEFIEQATGDNVSELMLKKIEFYTTTKKPPVWIPDEQDGSDDYDPYARRSHAERR